MVVGRAPSAGATPTDRQRFCHLGQRHLLAIPREGRGRVLCRLAAMLLLEAGILGPPVKEVPEGFVQMPQGLLGWYTVHLVQPGRRLLLFQGGERCRRIAVEEVLATLPVGIGAQAQAPVIDETRTAKRPGERVTLARDRITTVLVGAFLLHTCLFLFIYPKAVIGRRARLLPIPSTEMGVRRAKNSMNQAGRR